MKAAFTVILLLVFHVSAHALSRADNSAHILHSIFNAPQPVANGYTRISFAEARPTIYFNADPLHRRKLPSAIPGTPEFNLHRYHVATAMIVAGSIVTVLGAVAAISLIGSHEFTLHDDNNLGSAVSAFSLVLLFGGLGMLLPGIHLHKKYGLLTNHA